MSFGETFGSFCDSFDTVSYVCDTVRVVFFTPVTCAKRAHLENDIWYSCCLVGLFGWQTKGAMFLEMKFWTSTIVQAIGTTRRHAIYLDCK